MKRHLLNFFLFTLSALVCFAQTVPPTKVWTQLASAAGYRAETVGQFDAAAIVQGMYCLWGQYGTQTFSEENDYMGCFSYSDNRSQYLLQSGSWHSTHRPQTGHQWGYHFRNPTTGMMYWIANSGAQGLEEMWSLYAYDVDGLTSYDLPVFLEGTALTRPWIYGAGTLSGYAQYDSRNNVVLFFADNNLSANKVTVCTISTSMSCAVTALASGPPATQGTSNLVFNSDDGDTYFYPGNSTTLWRINAGNPAAGWSNLANATCIGSGCVFKVGTSGIGHPPARNAAGLANSTVDHLFLFAGGVQGSSAIQDVWTFDPAAGDGAGAWTEVCGPTGPTCGAFPNFTNQREGSRLQFDETDNVFMLAADNAVMWVYPYSAATGAFGRTCSVGCYGIKMPVSPVTGPYNRTAPPVYPSISNAQTGAFDLSIDAAKGSVYFASVQPRTPGSGGTCQFPVTYIQSINGIGSTTFLPGGTQATACAAIGNGSANQPSGHPFHAQVAGVDWEVHDKRNWAGYSSNGKAIIQSYSGGATGVWAGGDVGCFTAPCFSHSGTLPQNSPRGLLNANGTLMALTVETLSTFNQLSDLFVSNCTGINPCLPLTGSTPLNVAANSYVTGAAFNADPSGNLMVCWTEEVDATSRVTMLTTPQLRCKYWDGSSFRVIGGGSLNQATSSWARDPSVVYAGAAGWYVAYTEQSRTGLPKLYVLNCPLSGACVLVGGAALNQSANDLAFHASITADDTTVYVGWDDQPAVGQHSQGIIKSWNGATWSTLQSGIAADTTNGSVSDFSVVSPCAGNVTAAWTELTLGNAPQIFSATFAIRGSNGVTAK